MNNTSNKKITVIGIGGVGGFVGGMLADHYDQVTFVARGGRRKAIEEQGLVLHSDFRGERVVHPYRVVENAMELEVQDYVFVCVKNYSLAEICKSLGNCVDDHTVVVPIMNGADPGDRIRELLGKGIVLDSLIYIIAFADPDYSIRQVEMYCDIYLGAEAADAKQQVHEVAELLNQAEVNCHEAEDIRQAIWKKYIFNCAYNVLTAAYDNTIGQLRRDPVKAEQFESLMREAHAVAKAKDIHVTDADIDELLIRFREKLTDGATSSLQRDIVAGRQAEVETFSGYLVREAAKYGIATPVTDEMYGILKAKM